MSEVDGEFIAHAHQDIPELLEVARAATGVVRTAAPFVGAKEVVPQWWSALANALKALEEKK
jgi:hypothetical protein